MYQICPINIYGCMKVDLWIYRPLPPDLCLFMNGNSPITPNNQRLNNSLTLAGDKDLIFPASVLICCPAKLRKESEFPFVLCSPAQQQNWLSTFN